MQVVNIGIIIRNDHGRTFPVALTPQMVSVIQNLLTQIPVLNSKIVDPSGKKVAANASIPIIPRHVEFNWDEAYKPMLPAEEQKLMKQLNDEYKEEETNKPESATTDEAKKGGIIVPEGMGKNEDEADPEGKVTKLEKPAMFTDKDNPFNLTLDASGRANVDLDDEKAMNLAKTAGEELDKQTGSDEGEAIEAGSDVIGQAGEELKKEDVAPEAVQPYADLEKAGSDTEPDSADDKVSIGSEKAEEIHAERQEIARDELAEDEMADLAETAGKVGDCTVTPVNLKIKGEGNLPG